MAWAPTVELLGDILKWWPLQALALVAKFQTKVMTNGAFWQDACQLSQGIYLHSPLQGIPESEEVMFQSRQLVSCGVACHTRRVSTDLVDGYSACARNE